MITTSIFCEQVDVIFLLDLESTRATTSTSAFEFASLGSYVWFDSGMSVWVIDAGGVSKVGECFSRFGSSQEDRVGSFGCPQGELVERDAFSSGRDNSLACVFGESECANGQLGTLGHAHIVGDFSHDDGRLSVLVEHVLGKSVQSNGRLVNLGHVQTFQDGGAEFRIRSACEELVQFDQELVVRVGRFDGFHGALVPHSASTSF